MMAFARPRPSGKHVTTPWRKVLLDEVLPGVDVVGGRRLRGGEGLIYFNARYYDPTIGRFLTEDPSRKGVNWYSYCENNPVNRTDPTGMLPVDYVANQSTGSPAQQAYTFGPLGELVTAERWTAHEELKVFGIDIRLGEAGTTALVGISKVTFSSGSQKFDASYKVVIDRSSGVAFSFGFSGSNTDYTKFFPLGTTQSAVARSFEVACTVNDGHP
jgi:RHS repeat-associated protein